MRKVYKHGQYRDERFYIGGVEVFRRYLSGSLDTERETVHLSDDHRRVCMAETKTVSGGGAVMTPVTKLRFQLDNHLGTCAVEVEGDGAIISYEEYHPYGTSAYRAQSSSVDVSAKRYRYTGKERDESTGLYYHGARYYAPWLGRWTAADPLAFADGMGPYDYVRGSPVVLSDPSGRSGILADLKKSIGSATAAATQYVRAAEAEVQVEMLTGVREIPGQTQSTTPPDFNRTAEPLGSGDLTQGPVEEPGPVEGGELTGPDNLTDFVVVFGDRIAAGVGGASVTPLLVYAAVVPTATAFGSSAVAWASTLATGLVGGKQAVQGAVDGDPYEVAEGLLVAGSGYGMVGEGLSSGPRAGYRGLSRKHRDIIARIRDTGGDVYVDSVEEARLILRNLPELSPAPGSTERMPIPPNEQLKTHPTLKQLYKEPRGTYRGDLLNKGRDADGNPMRDQPLHGFDESHPHSSPHYNIKLPDGRKATIIIRQVPPI